MSLSLLKTAFITDFAFMIFIVVAVVVVTVCSVMLSVGGGLAVELA